MRSLYRHLLRHSLVVSLGPLVLLGLWLSWDLEQRRLGELRTELRAKTLLARQFLEHDRPEGAGQAAPVFSHITRPHGLGEADGLRLTLIRADGMVVVDSHEDPSRMENHRNRPEFLSAMATGEGTSQRHSKTLNQDLVYAAVALDRGGRRWGVVRGAISVRSVQAELARLRWTLGLAFGLALIATSLLASRLARRLSEPLDAVSKTARQVAEGEWALIARPSGPQEVQQLASDVNRMVERLRCLVQETAAGRAQLETVLAQMADGLVVLDAEGRIARMNPAACRLLQHAGPPAEGVPLLEAVPVYPLDAVARRALAGEHPEPVELRTPGDRRALRVLASPLPPEGARSGCVLLIQDLTEIRRVDEMRRDFVANVSHELRTPVAAMRALADTLVLRAGRRPEIVVEYAERLTREAERLGKLVEDLLTLSRIESGRWELRLEDLEAGRVVEEVLGRYHAAAEKSGVGLVTEDGPPVWVRADRGALETCLGNLVENALKYSGSPRVVVNVCLEGDEAVFTVEDYGIGIPAADLPRVFERFYRVDRSRSQEVEGTGLGLAIVRHLCESQGGRVWVESDRPEGTRRGARFHLALPAGRRDTGSAAAVSDG